jgi:superfamily I DNA/RNA helicase
VVRLNPAQRAAVEHGDGPLLVLAGAGSGKTRVITHRIARLVERGVRPSAILAVSFTNKAAAEMGERMVPLVGRDRAQRLWLSTFHRFGVRFLAEESRALGYPSRYVIFDQGDALGAVREIVKREGLALDRDLDLGAVYGRISLWKNAGLEPEQVPERDFEYDAVARAAYPHYERTLRTMCAVDFDDLVLLPVRILRRDAALRDKWRNRFRHLLVDEFQDTNAVQLELVKLLANDLGNVCVVGDDDQSIYGWRGAEVGNILDFERIFRGATMVKLEDNYRSGRRILEVANAAIGQARRKRHPKVLRVGKGRSEHHPVQLVTLPRPDAEARFVAKEIRKLKRQGLGLKHMAVLYRSNLQARLIEEELRVEGLPYRMFGGAQFFDRKEVKDAVAYLRVAVSPTDELSLRRIINYPARGLGDRTVARLHRWALYRDSTLFDALLHMEQLDDVAEATKRRGADLARTLLRARRGFETGSHLAGTARQLFDAVGLTEALSGPKQKKRWANVEYVLTALAKHQRESGEAKPSLAQFLTRLMLRIDQEEEETGERVTLSSLHASKGLEFEVVFLIGLNEGTLPHRRTTDPKVTEAAPTDVEEERRLFYVGVTRARERLYLCRPRARTLRGKTVPQIPTRFLEGLPEAAVAILEPTDPMQDVVEGDEAVSFGEALLAQLRK